MMPYTIIGYYKPEVWSLKRVGRDLVNKVLSLGYTPLPIGTHRLHKNAWKSRRYHADLRRRTPEGGEDLQWHKDGDTSGSQMDMQLALWASNTPTEFQLGDTIYQPKPYEIIVANNLDCLHRRPPYAKRVRWFFRMRLGQ